MSESNWHDSESAAASAARLIADFQMRQESLQRQAEELVRLREAVRAAAAREAAELLAAARANIRRVIVDARRELLASAAQLKAIAASPPDFARPVGLQGHAPESPMTDADNAPVQALQSRRALRVVLAESRTELEELAAHVESLTRADNRG
jgi:hypothetical protein